MKRRKVPPIPWKPTTPISWSPDHAYLKRHGFVTVHVYRDADGWSWEQLLIDGTVVAESVGSFDSSFAAILHFETYFRESVLNDDSE